MSTGSIHQTAGEVHSARAYEVSPAQPMVASTPQMTALAGMGAMLTALLGGVAELWRGVWSPGLSDSPTLSPLDIRDGGQYRR